jgi:peptidoglycan/LPS O-acetylase OafA/YrhL
LNATVVASTAVTWEDAPRGADPTAKSAQIASLTGLRGFAALMVVLIHVSIRTEYPWLGVPEYGPVSLFVLSGFLLYRPWARWGMGTAELPSVRTFAVRRVIRLFPAYLVVFLAVAIVYPGVRPDDPLGWLRMLTLTWIYQTGDLPLALLQTWSLGTELSWYVALPVMAGITGVLARRLSPRRGFWLTTVMLASAVPISAAWRWWVETADLSVYTMQTSWLPGYLFCFAGGAMVAHLVESYRYGVIPLLRLRRFASDPWALLVVALAAALLGTSPLGGPSGFLAPVGFAEHQVRVATAALVAIILLVAAVLGPMGSPLNRLLRTRWFNAVGRWSYGLYLWHVPIIVIVEPEIDFPSGPLGLLSRLGLVLAISLPLSAATYDWVERPTIAWSRRLFQPRETSAAKATTATQPTSPTPAAQRSDSAGG